MRFNFVDTHCHVDLYQNYLEIIDRSEKEKIFTIAVTNIPSVFGYMQKLCENKSFTKAALGFHPELIKERFREYELMSNLFDGVKFIGEIGLDFSRADEKDKEQQTEIFTKILIKCRQSPNKILTIHSRSAAEEVVSIIGNNYPGTIILHWFSGSINVLEKAILNGYYFSVNPSMSLSKKGQDIIKRIPRKKILTETDGPFVKTKGVPIEPIDVKSVLEKLGQLWGVTTTEAQMIVNTNFKTILDI